MIRWLIVVVLALLSAAGIAAAQGIFTCTTANGRKITSDRPIAECANQDQKELNASGSVKRNQWRSKKFGTGMALDMARMPVCANRQPLPPGATPQPV